MKPFASFPSVRSIWNRPSNSLPMTSSWKLRRRRCACAKKSYNQISERRVRTPSLKSRESCDQVRKKHKEERPPADVPRPLQLRHDLCGRRELRSSGNGMEPLFGLPRLRQAPRSQEPPAPDGLSSRRLLESG